MATLARDDGAAAPPRRKGVTRRGLLAAAGAGGALLIGYAVWPRRYSVAGLAGPGETALNPWLKIAADGRVTVFVPQAEMGQGIYSSLPQLVADELGADWTTVGVEPAVLSPVYANKGMLLDPTAGLPKAVRGFARFAGGRAAEHWDMQITGGSTSVRGFEMPLRAAGAGAREMLCRAAARRWGVDWRECDTKEGFVVHQARRASFGDLAAAAAKEEVPSSPVLRLAAARPLAGKPLMRLDIPGKTDGSARFGLDVRIPGMMYAAIAQNPLGATRRSIDKARLPAGARLVENPAFVAAVADGWFAAKTALAAVEIGYAPAAKPAGPWIEAGLKAALDGTGDAIETRGDIAAALNGPGAITADYTLPFLAHAALEPMNATVRIEGGRAEVWAPTQSITLTRWAVAKALGVEDSAVTVFPTLLGGAFGRKIETDASVQAALIAKAVGRPVQLIWSREQDMGHDMYRPPVAARLRGRVDGGRAVAFDAHLAVPDVASDFTGRNLPAMGGKPKTSADGVDGVPGLPYDFGAVRVTHSLADCPVPLGFWRSVGHSFSGFIVECFVDELAHAANADPGAFRLAMLKDAPRWAAVLRAALAAAGPLGQPVPGTGRGVAIHQSFGSIVAQVADVEAKPGAPLKVTRVVAAIDCGRVVNPDTVRAQVEGGIIFGLTAALKGRISFADGVAEQTNFDGYPLLTLAEAPAIEVIIVPSQEDPGGVGEPGTPPIAPAVANAVFAATGKRLRDLPLAWS